MGFVTRPGLPGKVYVPDKQGPLAGKHCCPDCFACQSCGQDRCRLCRGGGPRVDPDREKECNHAD